MWKKSYGVFKDTDPFRAVGETGIFLKLVQSTSGPGKMFQNALWHNDNVTTQVNYFTTFKLS